MRSVSSCDSAMQRNTKIEYESTLVSRCVATSVKAKASWNKINANSQDSTLFVATSVDVKVSWNKMRILGTARSSLLQVST